MKPPGALVGKAVMFSAVSYRFGWGDEAGYDTELYNWKLLYKAMGPADVISIVWFWGVGGLDTKLVTSSSMPI